ncbi:MAG: serine phosphatase RsbU (regulator of sigma subunit) [Crocinitomix sp.]|jgi:serine phosphatase RsbU (regulator of sigma subunit)
MSSLINRILGNLATRMMLIIYVCIIFITTFFIIFSYYNALALQEQRQYDKLTAIVTSMAVNIDGDEHVNLMNCYGVNTHEDTIKNDPLYKAISSRLRIVVEENSLSPMYTLVLDKETDEFVYGIRSDDFVDYKNTYKQPPTELIENMETGGVIPMYMSENGSWLSAFYPIKNSKGEVVAVLEADIEFSEFKAIVNERYQKELLIMLGVIIGLALFLIPYARKVLNADEIQRKLTLSQKLLIESKNRDIMDSIHYALKIQTAMLPPKSSFKDNGLEGFILHQAKDVVAGDFYWIERHGDDLFFAVADCTGHGVPGAILSLLCSNALNRAVDVLELRDTGEILDKVREMIIKRLGKGEGENMKDGMDIALCKLNLKTNKMQYSGANNPIYVYQKETGAISIAKPCKQPVGLFVKQHPFECKSYDLTPGDVVYLFTDGYADQFGGPNGKKFKYKPFRELILKGAVNPLSEQKNELQKSLRNWMRDVEQIDDICVMGVKI